MLLSGRKNLRLLFHTTKHLPRNSIKNLKNFFQITPFITLFPITTTTNRKHTFRKPTPTLKKMPKSTKSRWNRDRSESGNIQRQGGHNRNSFSCGNGDHARGISGKRN